MVLPPSVAGGPRQAVLDVALVLRGQLAVPSIVVLQASQGHPVTLLLVARWAEQGEVVVGITPAVGFWPYVVYFQYSGTEVVIPPQPWQNDPRQTPPFPLLSQSCHRVHVLVPAAAEADQDDRVLRQRRSELADVVDGVGRLQCRDDALGEGEQVEALQGL